MVVKIAGLREKQKVDRHRRMVSAASRLFTKHGYDATSMEAIADKAGVSVGTVYNYYESKSEILLAIVVQEGEETYASGQILLNEAESGASGVLDDLVVLYLKSPLRFMRKPEWRQAIALSILQPETRFGRQYRQVESRLEALSSQAIENLVKRGELVGVSEPTALGKVLFHTVHAAFVTFISNENVKFDDIHAELKTRIDAMLKCYFPGD